ncbi:hypothetical protein K439DRAFT_1358060, partial [Ramaria rubella]
HSFLVVMISLGIIAVLPGLLKNLSGIPLLLPMKLPNASTFFLTYIILQGLSGVACGFCIIVPLTLYYIKLTLLSLMPHSIWSIKYTLCNVMWGTLFLNTTLLVVISEPLLLHPSSACHMTTNPLLLQP